MESFGSDLFAVNLDVFRTLKPKWKASIGMMIRRARHAELISDDLERSLWINYSRRGWRRNEPYDDEMEPEGPRLLRSSFDLILSDGAQTPDDIAAAIALPATDIEALAGLQMGYLANFTRVSLRSQVRAQSATTRQGPASLLRFPVRPRSN
jgi:hypothetical protein